MGLGFHTYARVYGGKHPTLGPPILYPGAAKPCPLFPSSPGSGFSTFGLASVVRLHEVASTAAEVAALGVVAQL